MAWTLPEAEGEIEIFMEPPRYILGTCRMRPPCAGGSCKRAIELIHVVEDYGGAGEAAQWSEAQR